MSYVSKREGLGLSFSDVKAVVKGAIAQGPDVITATKLIIEDPALPRIAGLVEELHGLEQSSPSKPGRPSRPSVPGIGLKRVVTPLRLYTVGKERPVLGYAMLGGILAAPVLLGYILGKVFRK